MHSALCKENDSEQIKTQHFYCAVAHYSSSRKSLPGEIQQSCSPQLYVHIKNNIEVSANVSSPASSEGCLLNNTIAGGTAQQQHINQCTLLSASLNVKMTLFEQFHRRLTVYLQTDLCALSN